MSGSPLSRLKQLAFPGNVFLVENFSVAWKSPSNIALVKYWGKKNGQFPANPSISMTLDRAFTTTRVDVFFDEPAKGLISLNGDGDHPFLPKMRHLLHWMAGELTVLKRITMIATTENSFPHSTGIASSASGISAFTLCLLTVANKIQDFGCTSDELMKMASFAARHGSGSASRSLYGGFAVWGESSLIKGSSDEYAIPFREFIHPEMLSLHDAILVISGQPKVLPSTLGHTSMQGHPFFTGRITQAQQNLAEVFHALAANDVERLGAVAENEALTLHALIMSANPGFLLMKPATVEVIGRVREARKQGLPLFFTLDAGANVHVMYPADHAVKVENFIMEALQPLCEEGRIIFDRCGRGPVELNVTSSPGPFS